MLTITTIKSQLESHARRLAMQWGFNFSQPIENSYFLELTESHLQLQLNQAGKNSPGPISVNFTSGAVNYRRHFGGGLGQTLAKAVGLSKSPDLLILDATAGLGKDAFVFASLGAKVILVERSCISAALLEDGLIRGRLNSHISEIIQRMFLIHADSLTLLPRLEELSLPEPFNLQPDVIYLDPMFPHRSKTAQVKKEMTALQHLIGPECDSDQLLHICRDTAAKRVVVKRPVKAEFLAGSKPSFSMPMKKHRYDIYLT